MSQIVVQESSRRRPKSESAIWGIILVAWFLTVCIFPDPRPLGAPEWAVKVVRTAIGVSEPGARAITTVAMRSIGLGLIGVLVALSLSSVRLRWAAPIALITAPLICIASQYLNYGYFPIYAQIQIGVVSGVLGALAGIALGRSRLALIALVIIGAGLFFWASSTGITDELDHAARVTGLHILAEAKEIPSGDGGFEKLLEIAFTFAADNSHGEAAILPNKAAILALGVILGEEKVTKVAGRKFDLARVEEFDALRKRVTLRGRNDLVRHFWVSAALVILSDESRSMAVGIGKEMMDATPGGSGFSFVDLTADRAGTLFAAAATGSSKSALAMQLRIRQGASSSDFCPEIEGLPEGLTRDEFQKEYGGLGGPKTKEIVAEIQRRLAKCDGLIGASPNYSK